MIQEFLLLLQTKLVLQSQSGCGSSTKGHNNIPSLPNILQNKRKINYLFSYPSNPKLEDCNSLFLFVVIVINSNGKEIFVFGQTAVGDHSRSLSLHKRECSGLV